jgi:hypothetical protein
MEICESVQKIPEPTFFLSPLLGRNNKTWHIMSCINLTSCGRNMDFIIGIFILLKWLTEQENVGAVQYCNEVSQCRKSSQF